MAISRLFLTGILSTASLLLTPSQLTIAQSQELAPQEVSAITKPITVRIDGANQGSGIIIDKSGDIYTVLTNWHVVKDNGQYTIQTHDAEKQTVDYSQVQQLSDSVDLAIVKFTSTNDYQVAKLGESEKLEAGQKIYLSGYPGQLPNEPDRIYRFLTMNLEGIFPTPNKMGYQLTYRGGAFGGYSGSAILDETGLVIGIHGHVFYSIEGETFSYAVAIDTYKDLARQSNFEGEENQLIFDQNILDKANSLAITKQYALAIETAQQISSGRDLFFQAQKNISLWKQELEAQEYLSQAFKLAEQRTPDSLTRAIRTIRQVPSTTSSYSQVLPNVNDWSTEILVLAERSSYYSLEEAIVIARKIPSGTTGYRNAQSLIETWEKRWEQNLEAREQELKAQEYLKKAFELAEQRTPDSLAQAIRTIRQVPSTTSSYSQVLPNVNDWSTEILVLAERSSYYSLEEAIVIARKIPSGTTGYRNAQSLIKTWEKRLNLNSRR